MSLDSAALEAIQWRKALRSVGNGNCVEVAPVAAGIVVRDSKDPDGLVIRYSPHSWESFVKRARSDFFNFPRQ
jgi:hypothetical protein